LKSAPDVRVICDKPNSVRAQSLAAAGLPATAAAAATAATTTAAAAAAATTATKATAAATAATVLALFSFVHAKCTAFEVVSVHLLNRLGGFFSGPHRHEAEATRLTTVAVLDDVHVRDLSDGREGLTEGFSGCIE
jgi:hypothetical protein